MTKLVCSVDTCTYNSDHYCDKNAIQVNGSRAEMPASTCCASFQEKSSSSNCCSSCNSCSSHEERTEVACEAENCMYNKNRVCNATKIGIAGSGAKNMNQTECATFRKN